MNIPVDKVATKVAALGVPGLVLVVAMALTGWAGAAAIVAALAALGGPLGMLGGIALLGILLMVSHALSEYGFEALFSSVVAELHRQGTTNSEILERIEGYPISGDLKGKLRVLLQNLTPKKPRVRKPRRKQPKSVS